MAFNLIFWDSFDHYETAQILQKYGANSPTGQITSTNPRTGTQCCVLDSQGGPTTKNFGQQPNLLVGHAILPTVLGGAMMLFLQEGAGDAACFSTINADGSISMINHGPNQPGPVLVTTAPAIMQPGVYAYVEYGVIFSLNGSVYIRVNGVLVASATGVPTVHTSNPVDYCDAVSLSGPPSILIQRFYHDDFYVGYSDATIQDDFIGAIRIYPYIASANKTPLQWTPSANTNYQQVSNIPPDPTAYVSDDTLNDVDQYEMQPIPGHGPLGAFTIIGGQTVMSAALASAGSAQVAPDIAGSVGASVSPSTSFNMFTQPYLINPVTGVPFVPADFTGATTMGPKITG